MQLVRVYTKSRKYCAIATDGCELLLRRVQASRAVRFRMRMRSLDQSN